MRSKTYLNLLGPLLRKPLFTSAQARKIGVRSAVLSYYVKTGKLKRVYRGVYRGINSPVPSFQWEDLLQAVYSIPDGVICLISALAIYDLTEEIPRQHWIGIRHGTSVKTNLHIKIIRFRNLELGKTKIKLDGVCVPIFDKERTIIDAFRFLSRETAIKSLKTAMIKGGKNRLDLIKLQEYAGKLRFNIAPYLLSITT